MDGPGPSFQAELTIKRPDAAGGAVSARLTGAICTDDQLRQALGGVVFREDHVGNLVSGGQGRKFNRRKLSSFLSDSDATA